jgi:putative colanic acid biosynthesis acetyltransferase WcaF
MNSTIDPKLKPLALSKVASSHSLRSRVVRRWWNLVWLLLFRPTPVAFFGWRRFLLRVFGADLSKTCVIYPSVKIWAPWNLTMKASSCLADYVDCYCVAPIFIGENATVSQYTFLCTASHDYTKRDMPLIAKNIVVASRAWVCADVFVGPGVVIGEGAVVLARSVAVHDLEPWSVCAGHPAKKIKDRQYS